MSDSRYNNYKDKETIRRTKTKEKGRREKKGDYTKRKRITCQGNRSDKLDENRDRMENNDTKEKKPTRL